MIKMDARWTETMPNAKYTKRDEKKMRDEKNGCAMKQKDAESENWDARWESEYVFKLKNYLRCSGYSVRNTGLNLELEWLH